MDSIAEKFSVFDYFNMLIGGFVFLLGFGLCEYPDACEFIEDWAATIGESKFLLILSIVGLIATSFVIGILINEASSWYFKSKKKFEIKAIESCLNDKDIVGNPEKLARYREKASTQFFKREKNEYSKAECSDYFAHCVYYIQVRNQNGKPERLREVRGLSMLLSGVFALIPTINFLIAALSNTMCKNACVKLWVYPIFLVFAVVFGFKYKRDMLNRIRMVLAIYDVCVDEDNNADEPQQRKKERGNKRWDD